MDERDEVPGVWLACGHRAPDSDGKTGGLDLRQGAVRCAVCLRDELPTAVIKPRRGLATSSD